MSRWIFWGAVWFGAVLVAAKACYLGVPHLSDLADFWRSLAAISFRDVLAAAAAWAAARTALTLIGSRPRLARALVSLFVLVTASLTLYSVASVIAFGVLGGFLTIALLHLVGNVRMITSSITAYLTPGVVIGLTLLPFVYVGLVAASVRWASRMPAAPAVARWRSAGIVIALSAWVIVGFRVYATDWTTHYDWRIAENPPWVLAASWARSLGGDRNVRLADTFPPGDLTDFEPIGLRQTPPLSLTLRRKPPVARVSRASAPRRAPNVILLVLESVAARWTGISGGAYDTTPTLQSELARSLVGENFYAHVGRSSNSLASILLSVYPRLDFRDFTDEFPLVKRTSLATLFRDRGYRTSFLTASDMTWADWRPFVSARGFQEVRDDHDLPCDKLVSSWGVEDRCLVDGLIEFIDRDPGQPFFAMGWTQQTHHPYEPTPGIPVLDLFKETVPDAYDLGRYLNVLHETDAQLARLFDAVRRLNLADDTLIIVVGDHGQAFGFPHDSYLQGRTVYEEDVHVPLMFWFPRSYRTAVRSTVVGGQVDLAPTIAALAGMPPAADWQGSSLFDATRPPRAYFYVAQDEFKLGVRENNWKYILDLRVGAQELFDLDRDPTEQHNLAAAEPERCVRLRQRLAAWAEANRRQYERAAAPGI
ncbi:MAG TPA: sulfatase-like hydrolase/transferase [Vicinamibacterales bacterium]